MGEPQEVTPRSVSWYDNGPWKRTILYKDGDLHRFPLPHRDVLWQTINYKVPMNKVVALMTYDGSILVDRTRGEVTAHCDSEEANTLILNIANDIVTGEDTVEQAMAFHAQVVEGMRIHEPEEYPLKLRFKTAKTNATTRRSWRGSRVAAASDEYAASNLRRGARDRRVPRKTLRGFACRGSRDRAVDQHQIQRDNARRPGLQGQSCGRRRSRWPARPDVPATRRRRGRRLPLPARPPCC